MSFSNVRQIYFFFFSFVDCYGIPHKIRSCGMFLLKHTHNIRLIGPLIFTIKCIEYTKNASLNFHSENSELGDDVDSLWTLCFECFWFLFLMIYSVSVIILVHISSAWIPLFWPNILWGDEWNTKNICFLLWYDIKVSEIQCFNHSLV